MGRKKKETMKDTTSVAEFVQKSGEAVSEDIQARHAELTARIAEIHADAGYYRTRISGELKNRLVEKFDNKIEIQIAELENIPKADLEKAQGHIAGLREGKQMLLGVDYDAELKRLEEDLRAFEEANALFLQPSIPDGCSVVIETRILVAGEIDHERLADDLTAAGFGHLDQQNENEVWRHDSADDAVRAFVEEIRHNALVIEIRVE